MLGIVCTNEHTQARARWRVWRRNTRTVAKVRVPPRQNILLKISIFRGEFEKNHVITEKKVSRINKMAASPLRG